MVGAVNVYQSIMLNFQAILLSILAALVPIGVVQGNVSSNAGGGVTLSPILISEFTQCAIWIIFTHDMRSWHVQ